MTEESITVASASGYGIPALVGTPESGEATGTVVMAHGIFSDKEENGRYRRQVAIHHDQGRRTLRFDWQGHGQHPVDFVDSTIAGNVSDLAAMLQFIEQEWPDEDIFFIGSSFGASIYLLYQLLDLPQRVSQALLLNPVTDYRDTFHGPTEGELREPFSREKWQQVFTAGRAELLPGRTLGRTIAIELLTQAPWLGFDVLDAPTIVVHGTHDTSVSCVVTKRNAQRSSLVRFEEIEGADHAFASEWEERASFALIREWFAT